MPPLRCALYARVSTDEQAERYGLSSQLTELRALADRRGYAVVGEFIDDGWSGATLDRPRLTALRTLVRARGTDVILAHASDRLARDLGDLLVLRVEIRQAAARIEYVSHSPDETPEGELREQMLGAIAQYERAKIRERTSRGRREQARQGRRPGGRAPFGYLLDPQAPSRLTIDEREADLGPSHVRVGGGRRIALRNCAAPRCPRLPDEARVYLGSRVHPHDPALRGLRRPRPLQPAPRADWPP